MINLLSPAEKKKIKREYFLRIGVIAAIGLLVLELVVIGTLVPSYLAITSSVRALSDELELKKANILPGNAEAQVELVTLKEKIALLKSTTATSEIPVSTIIEEVLKEKPRGVDVSLFAYGNSGSDIVIQIGGFARTREELLAFQRSLSKSEGIFTDVQNAQNFITKKTDITFQLTLKLKN
jgi:hypothetical protein